MDQELQQLVESLKGAAGANLKSVILYGSTVSGEFQGKHSDVNLLCVFERLDPGELEKLSPPVAKWMTGQRTPPLLFTLDELRRSTDVFAIELLDIQREHRVLFGENTVASLEIPTGLHRAQVEHELRSRLLLLRQRFLEAPRDGEKLLDLMTSSISTFAVLLRHALIVLGEPPLSTKRQVIERVGAILGFDSTGLLAALDLREGKRPRSQVDGVSSFRAYLEGMARVVDEVDRRLRA